MMIEENEVLSPNDYQTQLPVKLGIQMIDHNIQEAKHSDKVSDLTQITHRNKKQFAQTMAKESQASRMKGQENSAIS